MQTDTSTHKDFINALNEDMMRPIKMVYIDLPYIQDIFLGSILLDNFKEECYNHIIDCLPKYNERYSLMHTDHFPKLNYTEDELYSYLKNSSNVEKILKTAPVTEIFLHLPELHKNILEHNEKVLLDEKQEKIKYIVNTYPLKLTTEQMSIIKDRLQFVSTEITVGVVSAPINKLPSTIYTDADIWFVYDISGLFDKETVGGKQFLDSLSLRNSVVYSPQRIGNSSVLDDLPFMKEDDINTVFADTAFVLNLYTEFNYLNSKIKIAEA